MPPQTPDSSTHRRSVFDDAPYDDDDEEVRTVFTTPSIRAWENSLSRAAKSRVDKVVGGRCLITNVAPENAVEYAHCLRRSFGLKKSEGKKISALELAWGMKNKTLNLDTRYNIFRFEPKIHKLFDKGLWILLPDEDIIDMYYVSRTSRKKFPAIKSKSTDNTFNYRFLAHFGMNSVPIHRQHGNLSGDRPLAAADFDFSAYPFTNIGIIKSHVHPRFVICSIAVSLSPALIAIYAGEHSNYSIHLAKVFEIYSAWTSSASEEDDNPPVPEQSNKPDEEDQDSNSAKTGTQRVTRSMKRGYPPGDPGGSSQPRGSGSKRSKGGLRDSEWLDEETLREFDKDISLNTAKDQKRKAVASWVASLRKDDDPEAIEHMWQSAVERRLVDDTG